MALILDTGPIVALLDADDPDHDRCVALAGVQRDLVIPTTVLTEVDHWVRKRLGTKAWRVFVEDVARGAYRLEQVTVADVVRAAELETRYEDLRLGLVDASVVAVCERLGEEKVATLDRRHFSIVRPAHCPSLRLLPD